MTSPLVPPYRLVFHEFVAAVYAIVNANVGAQPREHAPSLEPVSVHAAARSPGGDTLRVEQESVRLGEPGKPSRVSSGQLRTLQPLHLRPIKLVVYQRAYPVVPVGDLILGEASHLDAFSGYPCPTWLPGNAAGATTGPPEVSPPRSSRTRGSSPQITYAHSG